MTTPTAAPGWYRDGVTPGVLRWFDGAVWTDRTVPDPDASAPSFPDAGAWDPVRVTAEPTPWSGERPPWSAAQPGYAPESRYAPHPGYGVRPAYAPRPAPGASPGYFGQGPVPRTDDGPSSAVHWMLPVGRSWQSIVAGYLGLLSLGVWLLGPVAIGFGVWALVRASSGGHGRGRAVTGIVGGSIGTLVLIAFAASAGVG